MKRIFTMGHGGYCNLFLPIQAAEKFLYDWIHPIGGVIAKRLTKNVDAPLMLIFMIGQGGYCICFAYKAAKNSFMTDYNLLEVWFPRTHDQKSLTLRWRSFAWWAGRVLLSCFCLWWRLEVLWDWLKPIGGCYCQTHDQKSVDTPLTAHFTMAVSTICNHFIWYSPSLTCFGCLSGIFIYFLLDHYVVIKNT